MSDLGRLEPVDLRNEWSNEATGFTAWLSEDANLQILSDTLGIGLEFVRREQTVGRFSADLLCKESIGDRWVVIENQLEKTNHGHLGQLITYAAGLEAVTVVWIAKNVQDEHRAALDWLNEISEADVRFFALEIELWRIGDSLSAPRFNVICKPNDWVKTTETRARAEAGGNLTDLKAIYLDFWQAFSERMRAEFPRIRLSRPKPTQYIDIGLGGGAHIYCGITAQNNTIRAGVILQGPLSGALFDVLFENRIEIEEELGFSLDWNEKPDHMRSELVISQDECDPTDKRDWGRQFSWLSGKVARLHQVLKPAIDNFRALRNEAEE